MPADFYETLGVEAGASQEEIRKAFQRKSKDHHPDRDGGDDELMAEVNKAYHCLKDPQRRLEYDRTGSVSYVDQEQKIRARVRGVFSTLLQQPIEEDLVGAARRDCSSCTDDVCG
jgi:DnaJ-class molecular chaperone